MLSLSLRPHDLNDMVGQKNIIKDFMNRSRKIDFPQFMFFEGPTGSGKTTMAMIVAQLLNCHTPKLNDDGTHSPCQTCLSCKDIIDGKFMRDVRMLDCSSMGKEDVLDLKDRLALHPLFDKNKVYILDEAQNLGTAVSRGALLLLLEKKYKNCYMILNTMESSKIDRAITSRTQVFKFYPISVMDIGVYLVKWIEKNDPDGSLVPKSFIEKPLLMISEYAKGSLREAIQSLERCINGGIFSEKDIIQAFGFIDNDTVSSLVIKLLSKDFMFFRKYKELDSKDFFETFFSLSWGNLVDSWLYMMDKESIDNDYIKSICREYSKYDTMPELLEVYKKTYNLSKGFVNNSRMFFSILLSDYYPKKPKEEVKTILPQRPVRKA